MSAGESEDHVSSSRLTAYGFIWNAAEVTRLAEINGGVTLGIKAGTTDLQIYVSPTGRSVRIFKNHKEIK